MNRERRLLILVLVGIFVVLAGLLGWKWMQDARTKIVAGTEQVKEKTPPTPVLPPLRKSDPARGSSAENAVVIVEFADYECAYCRLLEREWTTVFRESKRPVALIWRDLPIISDKPQAILAPLAVRCAGEQGKFWGMHDAILAATDVSYSGLKSLARTLALDGTRFEACLTSGRHLEDLRADRQLAEEYHITAAPTFFINGQPFIGAHSAQEILAAISRAPAAQRP